MIWDLAGAVMMNARRFGHAQCFRDDTAVFVCCFYDMKK